MALLAEKLLRHTISIIHNYAIAHILYVHMLCEYQTATQWCRTKLSDRYITGNCLTSIGILTLAMNGLSKIPYMMSGYSLDERVQFCHDQGLVHHHLGRLGLW